MDWLNNPMEDLKRTFEEMKAKGMFPDENIEDLLKQMEERLKEQDAEHNGGRKWVGTQGYTPWGNSGWHPNGIRFGGEGQFRTAMAVASERKYRDFPEGQQAGYPPVPDGFPDAAAAVGAK